MGIVKERYKKEKEVGIKEQNKDASTALSFQHAMLPHRINYFNPYFTIVFGK